MATAGAVAVTDYGQFIPNDTAARGVNTSTINAALDAGGIICLPAGVFYLGNRAGWPHEATAIAITKSNVTLWGAGKGVTILHTVSLFANHQRGHGIFIPGTTSTPQHDVTLRDFELTADVGWTGCYDWDGDQPNCWDTSNKGIIVGWDTQGGGHVNTSRSRTFTCTSTGARSSTAAAETPARSRWSG